MKTKTGKKILSIILIGAMLMALLTACGTTEDNVDADANDGSSDSVNSDSESGYVSANIRVSADPTTLTPWGSQGSGRNTVCDLLYERLYFYNKETKSIENCIAESMEKISDTVYRVKIYDYVTDSMGNNVTADDVIFSFEKCIEAGNLTSKVNMISDMEKYDDYTVDFILYDDPSIGALDVALSSVYIVTEAAWDASGDDMVQNPIGTGCYVLTDYVSNSSWTFDLREDYWQTDESLRASCSLGNADHLYCPLVSETNAAAVALETGEIDTSMIGASARQTFLNDDGTVKDGYTMDVVSGVCVHMYFTCNEESPTSDINLRKAIAYCLDRTALGYQYGGDYAPKLNSIFFEGWLDGDYGQDPDSYYNQDLELAAEYLSQSDYNGETIRVMVVTSMSDIGPLIQSYMSSIGINCELLNYDRATFTSYTNASEWGDFDIVVQNVNANMYSWDAVSYLSGDGYEGNVNRLYIEDETLDELFQNAKVESRYTSDSIKELADYVQEQCYAIGLFSTNYTYFSNADVIETLAFGSFGDINAGSCIYK